MREPEDALLPDVGRVDDLARHVRRSPATIRRWLAAGTLPGAKVGRTWLIERESLVRALARMGARGARGAGQ